MLHALEYGPIMPAANARSENTPMPDTETAILLVEPDPDLRSAIGELLEVLGHQILVASNLEQAVLLQQQLGERIDGLIVSAYMPHSTGLEVVDALCSSEQRIPSLLYSIFAPDQAIQQRMSTDAVDFLSLPFSPEIFKIKIQEVLARRGNNGGAERSSM